MKRLSEKISGSIKDRPLVEVIGWIFAQSLQGELVVKVRKAEYKIFYFKGMPFYANSSLNSDNIFEALVSAGKLDRDDVPALEKKVEEGASPEKALLQMGVASSTDIYGTQQVLVREIIIRACGHREGSYDFRELDSSELEGLPMYDISPLAVIYEAISRFMLAALPEKIQNMSGEKVSLNPRVQELENLPEIFYHRTYLLDDFFQPMSVPEAVNLLVQEFKDMNQALTFFYVMYSTGILMISNHEKPDAKKMAAKESGRDETKKVSEAKQPANKDAAIQSDYIFVTGKKKKKSAPAKPQAPEPDVKAETKTASPQAQAPAPGPVVAGLQAEPGPKIDLNRKLDLLETILKPSNDFLQLFGVRPESPIPEIELAFLKLVKQYEIDEMIKGPDPELAKRAGEVKSRLGDAYNTLANPEQRDAYEKSIFPEEFKRAYTLPLKRELAKREFLRGKWFLDHHRADLALVRFEKAVELDPEQAEYFTYTGWAMYRANKGAMSEIEGYLKQALRISARSDQAYYFLGLIAKREGREEQAGEYFEKALAINPQNRSAGRELDTINKHKDSGIFGKIFSRRK